MKSDIDNKEWPDDYLSLKQVSAGNPFTVPAGYFDGLEQRIISSVQLNELVPSSSQQFAVPDNYFENLTSRITGRISIEAAAPADADNFAVPTGYFDELSSNIMGRINIEEAVTAGTGTFAVPEGYFEDMAAQIQSRIFVEEALSRETPFTVPDNYFEGLNRKVMNQAAGLEAVQRKGLVKRLISSGTFKYATAACFALVIGAGIFFGTITTPEAQHDSSYLHKALSEIPDNTIEGYLQYHLDNTGQKAASDVTGDNQLNQVSTDDLADYLSNN